jgi:hypothetical protein
MRFFCFTIAIVCLFANPAFAQDAAATIETPTDPASCGTPEAASLETEVDENFCNIYQRQMAYRGEAQAFRKKILERQKNFAAPRDAAYAAYKDEIKSLNDGRGGDSSNKSEYILNE